MNKELIIINSNKHLNENGIKYVYGTAGFRTKADTLDSVLFRCGLLASLRSQNLNGKVIGIMVTASHNPECDNGAKLVDPFGEMLDSSWESYATLLANAVTEEDLILALDSIISSTKTDLAITPSVVYGHDTRPSCPSLVKALEDGLDSMGAKKLTAGLVTTPLLHYLVRCYNTVGTKEAYGEPTEEGYFEKLSTAFKTLIEGRTLLSPLTVDCANGVGGPVLRKFASHIGSTSLPLNVTLDNTTTPGALNYQCGADYVKTQQQAPPGVTLIPNHRYCSFDGDADRIVFYFADEAGVFHLLDGDKIAGLVAGFLIGLVKDSGLELEVGVVQTAYANGASTQYLEKVLGVPVKCTNTGVKHLHHAALSFDIGVYFEANGHGTVLFSPSSSLKIVSHTPSTSSQILAHKNLTAITELINQTVGDAISDMLLVEIVLLHNKWGPKDWNSAYQDLPNRLVRVFVEDRYRFKVRDAERIVEKPEKLQDLVDEAVKKVEGGRSFVRPSGTEDCVRVYAEASTRELADELAQTISSIVFGIEGKGEKPVVFN